MITFLFWNIKGRPVQERIARMAKHYGADVIALAENETSQGRTLHALNKENDSDFHFCPSLCPRIELYARFKEELLHPLVESDRWTIRQVALPEKDEFLLAVAHLPSKLNQDDLDQYEASCAFALAIQEAEEQVGHSRTVLVGDLNMNPFERGVAGANALHGAMTRQIAMRESRRVAGNDHFFFYNPMWSLMGDGSKGPAGTYYRSDSGQMAYYWHTLDQVLLRPSLLPFFKFEDLHILTDDGVETLLTKNALPDQQKASDHLPILFKLHL